jgi:ABC-type nitrate/sulfonate/bicarbonate transport system ATPase subunit
VLALDEPFAALDAITRAEMQSWLGRVLLTEPRTVVLVTHDVEEAVVLADRVAVLSPRPGHVRAELEVDLPRPRSRTDAAVIALRERALTALGLQAEPTTEMNSEPGAETGMGTETNSGMGMQLGSGMNSGPETRTESGGAR